jgi:hypothetical protein
LLSVSTTVAAICILLAPADGSNEELLRQLARRVSIDLNQSTVAEAVAALEKASGVRIELGRRSSRTKGRISLRLADAALGSALVWLRWLGRDVGLRCQAGRIIVTSRQRVLADEAGYRRTEALLAHAELRARMAYLPKAQAALHRTVTCRLLDRPLDEAIEFVRSTTKLNVVMDRRALRQEGFSLATRIRVDMADASVRDVLGVLLSQINFTHLVQDEAILLTSRVKAAGGLVTRIYLTADLMAWLRDLRTGSLHPRLSRVNGDHPLPALVKWTLYPNSWETVDGHGRIEMFEPNRSLLVCQTRIVHDAIARLLTSLRRTPELQRAVASGQASLGWLPIGGGSRARSRIEQTLAKPVRIQFAAKPLGQMLVELRKATHVSFALDLPALQEEGVKADWPITLDGRRHPLRKTLETVLKPLNLTTMVTNDAVLITSRTRVRSTLTTRIYPAADLAPRDGLAAGFADELVDMLWESAGADTPGASIAALLPSLALVVTHTPIAQDRIAREIADLRRQVATED